MEQMENLTLKKSTDTKKVNKNCMDKLKRVW
jgi:hypothetical protein